MAEEVSCDKIDSVEANKASAFSIALSNDARLIFLSFSPATSREDGEESLFLAGAFLNRVNTCERVARLETV
jgi:hypothetical protein